MATFKRLGVIELFGIDEEQTEMMTEAMREMGETEGVVPFKRI